MYDAQFEPHIRPVLILCLFQKKNYQKRVLFPDFAAFFRSVPGGVHLK